MTADLLPSLHELAAIVCMASATYLTRIAGFLYLKNHNLSARSRAVLEASPCCVMVSVAAPSFVTSDPLQLASLLFTFLISFKTNLAVTICAGVAFSGLLQQLI